MLFSFNLLISFYLIVFFLQLSFQNPFECEKKFMHDMDAELLNQTKMYLRHVEPFDAINLLTEFIVCGDLSSYPDNALDFGYVQIIYDIYNLLFINFCMTFWWRILDNLNLA